MRRGVVLVGLTLACMLGLAACGGSSSRLIPAANAVTLGDDLTALSTALENHSCNATTVGLDQLQADIGALPSSVAPALRNNLINGENLLATHAPRQCHPAVHSTGPTGSDTGPTGSDTGPTGPDTGTSTSPQGGTTGPTTGPTTDTSPTGPETGPSTSPGGPTGPSNPTVGPGGGDQAPPGATDSTGDTGATE